MKQYRNLPKEDIIIERVRPSESDDGKRVARFIPVLLTPDPDQKETPSKSVSGITRSFTLSAGTGGVDNLSEAHRKKGRHIKPSASGSFMEIRYQNGTNYLFYGNHSAAEDAAVIYSLMGCCKTCKVNFRDWLIYVLNNIHSFDKDYSRDLAELLPHHWAETSKIQAVS